MSPQLAAFFAAHRTAILGGGAAAVAGLALLRRKKAGAAVPAGATAGATVIPGTIPAAAVAPSSPAAGYNSSNYDVYNALQPELEALRQTMGGGATPAAAAPIASSLLAPTFAGPLFRSSTGSIVEAESDGSLYGLTPADLAKADQMAGGHAAITQLNPGVPLPTWYDAASNLNKTTVNPATGLPKLPTPA